MSTPVLPSEPGPRWHSVEVTTTNPYGETFTRKVEGDDIWCAASLRALADQLDPPRPSLRDVMTGSSGSARRNPPAAVQAFPPSDTPRNNPMSLQ